METRANYALIGFFTMIVVMSAFGFVYWFSGNSGSTRRDSLRVIFAGSVTGLTKGSAVLFNGIRVGEVDNIQLLPEDPRSVVAVADIDRATPLRVDTRARLEYQGLTGVAQIALTGGEAVAAPLLAGPGQPAPTLYADRSDFQDLLETARTLARRTDDVLSKVDQLVAGSEGSVRNTIQNAERFSKALGDNADGIGKFLAQVGTVAERIGPLSQKLETLAGDFDGLVKAVDPRKVGQIVDDSASITQKLNRTADRIDGVLKAAEQFLGSASGQEGKDTFSEIREAARSIRTLSDNLDKRTAEITRGVTRFTGPGLREYEVLATDSRRTLSDINRVVRSLERNPQQVIFGAKPSIPEYDGAR